MEKVGWKGLFLFCQNTPEEDPQSITQFRQTLLAQNDLDPVKRRSGLKVLAPTRDFYWWFLKRNKRRESMQQTYETAGFNDEVGGATKESMKR